MPNHFHFMLIPNEEACENITLADKLTHMQNFSKAIGKTLSSYTKAINIQNKTTGNPFQKKTQAKCLSDLLRLDYLLTCFYYIHQNPLKANLVNRLEEWIYSSYPDYYGLRNGTLCNKKSAVEILSLSDTDLKNNFMKKIDEKIIEKLF